MKRVIVVLVMLAGLGISARADSGDDTYVNTCINIESKIIATGMQSADSIAVAACDGCCSANCHSQNLFGDFLGLCTHACQSRCDDECHIQQTAAACQNCCNSTMNVGACKANCNQAQ